MKRRDPGDLLAVFVLVSIFVTLSIILPIAINRYNEDSIKRQKCEDLGGIFSHPNNSASVCFKKSTTIKVD